MTLIQSLILYALFMYGFFVFVLAQDAWYVPAGLTLAGCGISLLAWLVISPLLGIQLGQ